MTQFSDAADMLLGRRLPDAEERAAAAFLASLGWRDGANADLRIALLGTADRMPHVFELTTPFAPGFAFVGGRVDPAAYGLEAGRFPIASVAGRGTDLGAAFTTCIGEAIEHLSSLAWGDEPIESRRALPEEAASFAPLLEDGDAASERDWTPARSLTRNAPAMVPMDLCLRRAQESAFRQVGSAAGESLTSATLSALFELIERDAAALWWVGGARARIVSAEAMRAASFEPLLAALRRDARDRRTWLLDITTDLEIPCVAAVSIDAAGRSFACGFAARASLEEAMRGALLELCQMELSNILTDIKFRRDGAAGLKAGDVRAHRRAEDIHAEACPLLFGARPPTTYDPPSEEPDEAALNRIVAHLESHGVECFAVDLTRPTIGVPVVRILAPRLQLLPYVSVTSRLERTIEETGGGGLYTNDIDLL